MSWGIYDIKYMCEDDEVVFTEYGWDNMFWDIVCLFYIAGASSTSTVWVEWTQFFVQINVK